MTDTVLALRDLLLSAGSIEGAYLRAARSEHTGHGQACPRRARSFSANA